MKFNRIVFSVVLVAFCFLVGCSKSPGQGEGLVFVKKPLIFGESGVSNEVKGTGTWFMFPTTNGVIVNLKPVQTEEKIIDLATKDKILIDFDVTLQFKLKKDDYWIIVDKYGNLSNWYNDVMKQPFLEKVRNYARGQNFVDMMYSADTLIIMGNQVAEEAAKMVDDTGAPVEIIKVVIGKANPPEKLTEQIEATAVQKERKQTETQRGLAEVERATSEEKKALADKAYLNGLNMTVDQYLESRKLDIQEQAVLKGKANFTIIAGGTGVIPTHPIR